MRTLRLLLLTTLAVAACSEENAVAPKIDPQPRLSINAAGSVTEEPFHLFFYDVNPCTGLTESFSFDGTARVQSVGDLTVVHISGTVTTSDGWQGVFNRQFVFKGDQVITARFFDMEVGANHERQLFTGNFHVTVVDGKPVVEFGRFQLRCVVKA